MRRRGRQILRDVSEGGQLGSGGWKSRERVTDSFWGGEVGGRYKVDNTHGLQSMAEEEGQLARGKDGSRRRRSNLLFFLSNKE